MNQNFKQIEWRLLKHKQQIQELEYHLKHENVKKFKMIDVLKQFENISTAFYEIKDILFDDD